MYVFSAATMATELTILGYVVYSERVNITPTSEAERADSRELAVLDAAVGVFARYGYRKASMDEVARAAGISDDVAGPVVDLWRRMDAAMPEADITDMYRYTQKGRRS